MLNCLRMAMHRCKYQSGLFIFQTLCLNVHNEAKSRILISLYLL